MSRLCPGLGRWDGGGCQTPYDHCPTVPRSWQLAGTSASWGREGCVGLRIWEFESKARDPPVFGAGVQQVEENVKALSASCLQPPAQDSLHPQGATVL